MIRATDILDTFYVRSGDTYRAPAVNETCCVRPKLAEFLTLVAAEGPQPVIERHAQARCMLSGSQSCLIPPSC